MEIPDLVRQAVGDEEIEVGVNLGDEDVVCLTPMRTLLYRADGLLSDEKVEEYPHEVERLDVKEGRRKTKFTIEYVDGPRSFSVPTNRDQQVLELLMTGILRAADVAAPDESVAGVFRFSEMALFVTEARVVKHIGAAVWTDDFEVYPFEDLTGLSYEEGSVATEVILEVDGRPNRVKTPNEDARKVQQVLEDALFSAYGVSSLDNLNDRIGQDDPEDADGSDDGGTDAGAGGGLELGEGIDPLVTGEDDEPVEPADIDTPATGETDAGGGGGSDTATADDGADAADESDATGASESDGEETETSGAASDDGTAAGPAGAAELEAVEAQLGELTTAVKRQNQLLKKQQDTIKQLIEELREGRGE
jgi:hypothetical protein